MASKRAALTPTKLADGSNTVHEPVVKSSSRVPIAMTRSASVTTTLAAPAPVTPTGPA